VQWLHRTQARVARSSAVLFAKLTVVKAATRRCDAGFIELEYYYRPTGLPREQQPWLASVWRRPGPHMRDYEDNVAGAGCGSP
jgi:hypothetical protein